MNVNANTYRQYYQLLYIKKNKIISVGLYMSLTRLQFFFIKYTVYANNPQTIGNLKIYICGVVDEFDLNIYNKIIEN